LTPGSLTTHGFLFDAVPQSTVIVREHSRISSVGTVIPQRTWRGIQALEDIEDIAICMVPNIWSTTVQQTLISHCEYMRYRFGILDPQDGLSIDGIRTFREPLDTKYAALYYPWLEVRDPSVQRNVQVAPSGHMAGIYARVDVERGVHLLSTLPARGSGCDSPGLLSCSCSTKGLCVVSFVRIWITITARERISPWGRTRPSRDRSSRSTWGEW
jgi:hypothetical protein